MAKPNNINVTPGGGGGARTSGGITGTGGAKVNPINKNGSALPKTAKDIEKSLWSGFTIKFGNGPVQQIKPKR